MLDRTGEYLGTGVTKICMETYLRGNVLGDKSMGAYVPGKITSYTITSHKTIAVIT